MKEFIISHLELVVSVVLTFVEVVLLILCCVLKRKQVDPSLTNVITKLPLMISHAEVVYGNGHGEEKKDSVISCALALYKSLTGIDIKVDSTVYRMISDAIEMILSTPQKKG